MVMLDCEDVLLMLDGRFVGNGLEASVEAVSRQYQGSIKAVSKQRQQSTGAMFLCKDNNISNERASTVWTRSEMGMGLHVET